MSTPANLLQGQCVGLIGAGYVGRRVIRLLQPFAVKLSVYDPYLSPADAADLGVQQGRSRHPVRPQPHRLRACADHTRDSSHDRRDAACPAPGECRLH